MPLTCNTTLTKGKVLASQKEEDGPWTRLRILMGRRLAAQEAQEPEKKLVKQEAQESDGTVMKDETDRVAVEQSRMGIKNDKVPPKAKRITKNWSTVRRKVKTEQVRALFGQICKDAVCPNTCSDTGFLTLMKQRHQEVYGREMDPEKVTLLFVKSCYIEYYIGHTVDYVAVEESRPRTSEHNTRSAAVDTHVDSLLAPKDTPSPKRSASPLEGHAGKTLKCYLSELDMIKSRLKKIRSGMVNKISSTHGKPALGQHIKEAKCAICLQGLANEGWYTLGCCRREYHMRCLLPHALSSCSCVVCKAGIPREFYLSVGREGKMPSR